MDSQIVAFGIIVLIGAGAVALWPQSGLIWRIQRLRQHSRRVQVEDALKHIYDFSHRDLPVTPESLSGRLRLGRDAVMVLVEDLLQHRLVRYDAGTVSLTPKGEAMAVNVIRAHRLWETHLAQETGYGETEWHAQAERQEHRLSDEEIEDLSARLGHPVYDPHGDPIPVDGPHDPAEIGVPLDTAPLGCYRIRHLEDEPGVVYAQLIADGLHPGLTVEVLEKDPERIRILAAGEEIRLAPLFATNVTVVPAVEVRGQSSQTTLAEIRPGQIATVTAITQACRGPERRRLMDLGILPGADIEVEMNSPLGDPTAYRVRDAIIALRREQARLIQVEPVQEDQGQRIAHR